MESRCDPGVGAGAFPLTPALSRRERGNRVQSLANPTLQPCSQAQPVPPSPWGEGRGEGESNLSPGLALSGSTVHPISCCLAYPRIRLRSSEASESDDLLGLAHRESAPCWLCCCRCHPPSDALTGPPIRPCRLSGRPPFLAPNPCPAPRKPGPPPKVLGLIQNLPPVPGREPLTIAF